MTRGYLHLLRSASKFPNRQRQRQGRRQHFTELLDYPNLVRGIVNTMVIGVVGGAAAVACYTAIALAQHRWHSPWAKVMEYYQLRNQIAHGDLRPPRIEVSEVAKDFYLIVAALQD